MKMLECMYVAVKTKTPKEVTNAIQYFTPNYCNNT